MLIIDQLQKDDRRLRTVAILALSGMLLLAIGLWRLQVAAAQHYRGSEAAQSIRLVRVPAVRGKVLDRNGTPLAENRPSYDVNLYLEELRPSFRFEFTNRVVREFRASHPGLKKASTQESLDLQENARLNVYSNTVMAVATALGADLPLSGARFQQHYRQALALPLPVIESLTPAQMALFFERCIGIPGVDLEVQAVRTYPYHQLAAHLLGHLRRADEADNDPEPLVFRYRLRDFEGVAGVEARFDSVLRGRAGVKSLRVDSQGFRHEETILQPTEPGLNVRLSIDLGIQAAAERALGTVAGAETRGAVVVMDVRNGDLLAIVSAPGFDPNDFVGGMSEEEFALLNDEKARPQMNRAISGAYAPGSIFKVIVALAALDAGVLEPLQTNHYLGYWPLPDRRIDDTAPPGDYDFKRAFKRSCNAYFIDHGLRSGRARIIAMAQRFGLGEASGFPLGPESRGFLPDTRYLARLREQRDAWTEGDTAILSIGQGALTVSPLQMTVMTAAVANGGHLLEPRVVLQVEDASGTVVSALPPRIRAETHVDPRHLELLRKAMLADVEEKEGTGSEAAVPGLRVCGKTGTAEIKRGRVLLDKVTWFVAFAPFESPRFAVVVVVESGGSGGRTAAPVARQVFLALRDRESGVSRRGRTAASVGTPRPESAAPRSTAPLMVAGIDPNESRPSRAGEGVASPSARTGGRP